jgi:YesN/AraC family two-component response regulator
MDKNIRVVGIAYHVGFNNLSYFYRNFKKYTGLTPLEYKQRSGFRKLVSQAL